MTVTRPVMRYHGGKFRLAPWIIGHFPPHRNYTEAFGGAAGVLVQKPRAYAEVYNDLDGDVVNLFRVLQDGHARRRLTELLVFTPYARAEFDLAWEPAEDPVERARRLVVRAMMGFGSAGATKGSTGFRIDTKREYATAQHTWAMYPFNLAAVGQRLTGVLIENRPAIEVILAHDTPETLHYVDPPYLHETRCRANPKNANRGYRHEMTDEDHLALLDALRGGGKGDGGAVGVRIRALRPSPPWLGEMHYYGADLGGKRHLLATGGAVAQSSLPARPAWPTRSLCRSALIQ